MSGEVFANCLWYCVTGWIAILVQSLKDIVVSCMPFIHDIDKESKSFLQCGNYDNVRTVPAV